MSRADVTLTTTPVTVVVEPDRRRPPSGGGSARRRAPGSERVTAWMVIVLVFLCGGLALFDLFLLLAGVR